MKRVFLAAVAAALLFAAPGVGANQSEGDARTLSGRFVWGHGNATGDLEAVFRPNGDGEWKVDFRFEFHGKPHVYSGSASGSLSDGKLKGRVFNERKKRTFTFEGMFEDGKFSGTHAEIHGDEASSTGTLTLN